jgi:hypothetical protein
VNMKESTDAGIATTAMLSAELNRRLSQKSTPLCPIGEFKRQMGRLFHRPAEGLRLNQTA